ncbi:hypothetical protein [Devosia nitrariae]|uniref:Uncharacterized protein n=1 Tax=Devosia nitrariae TaxID=2071872 RepID=A0ABQ5W0M1_9HYPH|nr:hypothetical protein [Devosia nitrariae]GLQ53619.1 hypothetical protein GCM10010862_08780 [Devosia nitrariae]
MRGHEILDQISWSGDMHPDTISQIEAAILDLDRKAHGTNRPAFNAMEVHRRLTVFISERGGYRKAAEVLGISKSFLFDMHAGERPVTPAVLHRLGLQKSIKEIYSPVA